ncbi:gamma carbonic anhydrase family protein [Hydromonas duriensis]|uniref:Carbonic anhydrase/acetyltransferase-like protein (Isoleucine patch superfamily) n=1 Tax=Hydromonas duriensis TaxID=1527608 RepID=A0A4R6YBT9_9BURK|nr:gamma carbonic anhydrase family protein [Hydromonas duriensis]TDR33064.1 carbonic anhydrase/acetyltransferase-like protein (isoleucine patch superfamily) [Hydromonas duriensis]
MPLYRFHEHAPIVAEKTFVAPTAVLIGKVILHIGANIWYGSVLRGDNETITVGENSNIQENSILHTDIGCPLRIGANVTIGHGVTLHGCTVDDNSLIGMGAIILNRATIGKNSVVGAGALVTEGKNFPDGALIVGSPAKMARLLTEEEIAALPNNAHHYASRGQDYLTHTQEI